MTLKDLAALKRITGLQLLPTIDSTRLHTDHILVAVLGLEIADAIRLLNPRVPDDRILQIVTNHIETRLAVKQDRGSVLLNVLVDSVSLTGDTNGRVALSLLAGVEDLVDVVRAAEAIDLNLGNVLNRQCQHKFSKRYTRCRHIVFHGHAVVAAGGKLARLRGVLAHVFPLGITREAMLRKLASRVSYRYCSYREDNRNTSSDRFAPIELRCRAHPQILLAIALPAYDSRAVEQDFDAIAGGEGCSYTVSLALDGGLRGSGGRGDRRRLVGALNHLGSK
ncbi:galactose mutarotase-like protein [Hortaea werneckii]|nr:galactose mutarotase-like protein [Hortaea werneckii]KAI7245801.1 galactose mutarotase-like protein [Hortaea werneckii]